MWLLRRKARSESRLGHSQAGGPHVGSHVTPPFAHWGSRSHWHLLCGLVMIVTCENASKTLSKGDQVPRWCLFRNLFSVLTALCNPFCGALTSLSVCLPLRGQEGPTGLRISLTASPVFVQNHPGRRASAS